MLELSYPLASVAYIQIDAYFLPYNSSAIRPSNGEGSFFNGPEIENQHEYQRKFLIMSMSNSIQL